MILRKYGYQENVGDPREWVLVPSNFGHINLIVGQNASGKTRFINTFIGLSKFIKNSIRPLWTSGEYSVDFEHDGKTFSYQLSVGDRKVNFELLQIDGETMLSRGPDGRGYAWSDPLNAKLEFKISNETAGLVAKRDEIQHPFLEPIHEWANSIRRYNFGSDMGRSFIYAHNMSESLDSTSSENTVTSLPDEPDGVNSVGRMYVSGFSAFGEKFDEAILRDFKSIGYDCAEINAGPNNDLSLPVALPPNTLPVMISVLERDLKGPTWQYDMSMGMFRALALIIHMNYSVMSKQPSCIVIDDIGEGLDFERSTSLIKLLIERATGGNFQLFMTTNDRFVMNEVDLKYWHVINRLGSTVEMIDKENSGNLFENFRFLGLNNFDFFSSKMYLEEEDEKSGDLC